MQSRATCLGLTLVIAASQPKKTGNDGAPQPKNEAVTKLLETQLQAAKKAQIAAIDTMQVKQVGGVLVLANSNHTNSEEGYTWSVRWLHAQRDLSESKDERIAAFVDHHKRMKEMKAMVATLVGDGKGGLMTPAESAIAGPAAEWYLAQAELWLLQERGK